MSIEITLGCTSNLTKLTTPANGLPGGAVTKPLLGHSKRVTLVVSEISYLSTQKNMEIRLWGRFHNTTTYKPLYAWKENRCYPWIAEVPVKELYKFPEAAAAIILSELPAGLTSVAFEFLGDGSVTLDASDDVIT
jgi:hypothetical protein